MLLRLDCDARCQRPDPTVCGHLHVGLSDPGSARRFGDAEALKASVPNCAGLLCGQGIEQCCHVESRNDCGFEIVVCRTLIEVVDRLVGSQAAEMIDHLVPRDREKPGREGASAIEAVSPFMDRQEHFLDEIFCFCCSVAKASEEVGA